jgi:hypothetical protein
MPTDTTALKYNYDRHLYVLDLVWVKNNLGIDFVDITGSETKARDKLYQISRTIYNFIYKHTNYKKAMEYRLAFDDTLQATIQVALEEQARYENEMNAEYLAYQSGVNVLNGVTIPLERLRGVVRISPNAEDRLRQDKLLYTGQLLSPIRESEYDYTTLGY